MILTKHNVDAQFCSEELKSQIKDLFVYIDVMSAEVCNWKNNSEHWRGKYEKVKEELDGIFYSNTPRVRTPAPDGSKKGLP